MNQYRRGSHNVFRLHMHLVWCTKYRKPVLRGDVGFRLRDLLRQLASDLEVEILSGVVAKNHVHLLVSFPPQMAVSKIVQRFKGKSSYTLQREFESVRRQYWGQRMWARGDFACTTGNVTDEMIRQYIENHPDDEDPFRVQGDDE